MVSMIVLISGDRLWISRAASSPFNSGMDRSITAISGFSVRANLSASWPSAASPTTTWPAFSSMPRNPWRTIWWSSAKSTRISASERDVDLNGRPIQRSGDNSQRPSQSADPFADSGQPQTLRLAVWIKALAIVTNAAPYFGRRVLQFDPDRSGCRVLDGIVEGLLHDPVKRRFHCRGQTRVVAAGERHIDSGALGHFLGEKLQSREQSQIVQYGRTPFVRQIAQPALDQREHAADLFETSALSGRKLAGGIRHGNMHRCK